MLHELLQDVKFHASLLELDFIVAREARGAGCGRCGGRLHAASYPRKPRGLPDLPEGYDVRLSFCCAIDGCRKRVTPSSFRFLGRKVYVATIVVLACALREGPTPTRMKRIQQMTGVSRRTVERWCGWWRTAFAASGFWDTASASFMPPVNTGSLPASLLERFVGDGDAQLRALLRLLGPITGNATDQVC